MGQRYEMVWNIYSPKIGTYYVSTWQLWFEIPIIKWSAKICTYVLCGNSGTFCGKSETHKWYGNLILLTYPV